MRDRTKKKTRLESKIKSKGKKVFLLQLVFVIIIIISLKNIVTWKIDNNESQKILEEISSVIEIETEKEIEKGQGQEESTNFKYNVDFETLKEKNADTVGWIKVNGTNIDYPVVKSTDNSFYLSHNFYKEYSAAGWIFASYTNKIDGTDKNLVIYGHNRKDGSMFGSAKNFLEKEWYENEKNRYITFITEIENVTYEVFSIYQIEKEAYYATTEFENDEFESFIRTIKSRSMVDFGVNVTAEDGILTLTTCANDNQYRTVLHAKKL